jgi:hypothetical protein
VQKMIRSLDCALQRAPLSRADSGKSGSSMTSYVSPSDKSNRRACETRPVEMTTLSETKPK